MMMMIPNQIIHDQEVAVYPRVNDSFMSESKAFLYGGNDSSGITSSPFKICEEYKITEGTKDLLIMLEKGN